MNEYTKEVAKLYDRFLYPALHRIRKKTVSLAKKYNAKKIVDLCCGTGNQLHYFNRAGYGDVVGVDLTDTMLNVARKRYDVNCLKQDATATSFDSDSFDMAIIAFALHEKKLEIAKQIVVEAKRIVKPQGFLCILDYAIDDKSTALGRKASYFVERKMGEEHYGNFLEYVKVGGLPFFVGEITEKLEEYRFIFNTVVLNFYKFKNN